MRSRLTTLLTVLGLSMTLGVVSAPAARAEDPCVVDGFSPRTVVVGLTPIAKTFRVATSGCTLAYWKAESDVFYVYPKAPEQTFDPRSNAEAGVRDVAVDAWNYDYEPSYRDFPDSFSLLRRTAWQDKSFNASPEPAKRGSAITVTGRLLVVDWTNGRYVPYANRGVAVEFRTPTGSYTRVKAVTTDATGWVRTTVPADSSGTWRLRYGGNTVAGPAVTVGDAVQVVP